MMAQKIRLMFATAIMLGVVVIILELCLLLYNSVDLTFSDNSEIPIILWWTPFGSDTQIKTCGNARCYLTHNRTFETNVRLKSILFYGSNFRVYDLPNWRSNVITWGLFHEESPRNNPILVHEKALNLFNYSSTFSRFSNVPLTLLDLPDLETLIAPVLYIQSDCDTASDRDYYVLELMKHIRVDSYGACINNARLDDRLRNNYLDKLNNHEFLSFVAEYKFTIAFENAICDDYITEKLWRPLIVGSVPIYYGSPSFKDWLPNDKSAVSILDFASPVTLATFLHELLRNDSAYEEYLSHKLNNHEYRVTNKRLLNVLEKRPSKVPNEFGNYVDKFECFVCEQVQNTHKSQEISIVTRRQYDCPLPKDPIKRDKSSKRNWWKEQWNIEKCGAKLLHHYVINNISIDVNHFNEQKMNMYDNNKC
ncbi:alpha-(1,3)-fucosyltransferase 10 isoform X2 [Pseudomyrmex gracilis]|uniref:alpha-(1,3)-fucosyltransferase 10 isoform X2 n=1 Tax=Pseudomyrmex gracilis TaxID=219809 RepID=UPI000994E573|nr:alpha-(1,3)-fucosyltransferase 10 isoform X2 [Pseudomyrmex gracilis]